MLSGCHRRLDRQRRPGRGPRLAVRCNDGAVVRPIGREREVAALERAVAQAVLGNGGVAVVSGEPGVGQDRLGPSGSPGNTAERELLDLAVLGTADPLGTGQPGQRLVAVAWLQQALQVVAVAAPHGQAGEQDVEPLA